jgi:starvation-inducible DNA-binding protein
MIFMKTELSTALNQYLANVAVEYVKLHNLHWNVVGSSFKQVHEYLETLYDGFADVLDGVAELLKMHDIQPLASMKDYLAAATIQELGSVELSTSEALSIARGDLLVLKAQAESIRSAADADDVYDVVAAMEEQLSDYNKTLWFLQAMGK